MYSLYIVLLLDIGLDHRNQVINTKKIWVLDTSPRWYNNKTCIYYNFLTVSNNLGSTLKTYIDHVMREYERINASSNYNNSIKKYDSGIKGAQN